MKFIPYAEQRVAPRPRIAKPDSTVWPSEAAFGLMFATLCAWLRLR